MWSVFTSRSKKEPSGNWLVQCRIEKRVSSKLTSSLSRLPFTRQPNSDRACSSIYISAHNSVSSLACTSSLLLSPVACRRSRSKWNVCSSAKLTAWATLACSRLVNSTCSRAMNFVGTEKIGCHSNTMSTSLGFQSHVDFVVTPQPSHDPLYMIYGTPSWRSRVARESKIFYVVWHLNIEFGYSIGDINYLVYLGKFGAPGL